MKWFLCGFVHSPHLFSQFSTAVRFLKALTFEVIFLSCTISPIVMLKGSYTLKFWVWPLKFDGIYLAWPLERLIDRCPQIRFKEEADEEACWEPGKGWRDRSFFIFGSFDLGSLKTIVSSRSFVVLQWEHDELKLVSELPIMGALLPHSNPSSLQHQFPFLLRKFPQLEFCLSHFAFYWNHSPLLHTGSHTPAAVGHWKVIGLGPNHHHRTAPLRLAVPLRSAAGEASHAPLLSQGTWDKLKLEA